MTFSVLFHSQIYPGYRILICLYSPECMCLRDLDSMQHQNKEAGFRHIVKLLWETLLSPLPKHNECSIHAWVLIKSALSTKGCNIERSRPPVARKRHS